jgi:predicted phage-related endonuclease
LTGIFHLWFNFYIRLKQPIQGKAQIGQEARNKMVKNLGSFAEAANRYKDLNTRIRELEKEKESLKEQICGYMTRQGKNEIQVGKDWSVKYTKVTSKRLDTKWLKAKEPTIYEKYASESTTYRLTLELK